MWTEEMREKLEKRLNISAQNIYGLTEIIGPGVAMDVQLKKDCIYSKTISIQK